MKKLKEYKSAVRGIDRRIKSLEKHLKAEYEKRRTLIKTTPLHCKKCGIAYETKEVGYKEFKSRRTQMVYDGCGSYDVHQKVMKHYYCACPKCGKLFYPPRRARPDEFVSSTQWYDRHDENTPDFRPEYFKCVDETVSPVGEREIEFMNRSANF